MKMQVSKLIHVLMMAMLARAQRRPDDDGIPDFHTAEPPKTQGSNSSYGIHNPAGIRGKATTFKYEFRANVATVVVGADSAVAVGFDENNKNFAINGLNDSNYVPYQLPKSGDSLFVRPQQAAEQWGRDLAVRVGDNNKKYS
ncbi:hypothetical protein GGS21DRAFT_490012 [Xylaria nigripes]|nr:hypothetical protein GGS21DRAFT_490012 [Xylaria nigripes]